MSAFAARFKSRFLLLAMCAGLWSGHAWAQRQMENPTVYQDPKTGLTIVTGEIVLGGGWYMPSQPEPGAAVEQLMWVDIGAPLDTNGEELDPQANPEKYWSAKRSYRIGGLLRDPNAASITITLYKPADKSEETLVLDLAAAQKHAGDEADFGKWAQRRQMGWSWVSDPAASVMIPEAWQQKGQQIYGVEFYDYNARRRDRWSGRHSEMDLGTMALFGGQVAIGETLQTQVLNHSAAGAGEQEKPTIPVKTLSGVMVASHPYAEMVKAQKLAAPPASLADYVPADRLMALMRKPEQFAGIFDIDSRVLARLGSFGGGGFVDYDLLERYAARFGVTPKQVKNWLASGSITEVAVFTPDVFFLDSTDLTLVARLDPGMAKLSGLGGALSGITPMPLADGKTFYVSVQKDLLLVSTSKSELESTLALVKKDGEGSLGRSDEFRVMTHELPLQTGAGVYVYFSDSFIRHLTGPEVKINQLRRAVARAQMQSIAATAVLYRLDQGTEGSLADLKQKGYLLEEEAPAAEFALEPGAVVRSKTWGTLAQLDTLTANPVKTVFKAEEAAYQEYIDRYTDFWREYFDPIAVRLDLSEDGGISLETFILPLIDNSIYNALKEALGTQRPEKSTMPRYDVPPVMSLAFQVPMEKMSESMLDEYAFRALRYQIQPILNGLGGGVVFSIQDDAPILQTSYPGSIAEQNGYGRMFGFRNEELLIVPILSALFSRPVDLAIEIKNEAVVRKGLEALYFQSEDYIGVEHVTYEDDGTKVIALNLMGMIRMELSLRIEHGWLHVSNHPWSPVSIVGNQEIAPAQALIDVIPSAVKKGLPQTASLMQSVYRNAIYASAAELLPWMNAFAVDAPTAVGLQKKALGRSTPLPSEVTLDVKRGIEAKPYGTWRRQTMPANTDQAISMPSMPDIRLWMRFEGNGLRSRMEFLDK